MCQGAGKNHTLVSEKSHLGAENRHDKVGGTERNKTQHEIQIFLTVLAFSFWNSIQQLQAPSNETGKPKGKRRGREGGGTILSDAGHLVFTWLAP